MSNLFRGLFAAALIGPAAAAHALPVVGVSDSLAGNAFWPAPTACSSPGAGLCAPIVTFIPGPPGPPADGYKLARPFTVAAPGDAGAETFAVSYQDGVIGDYVNGRGMLDVRADSTYFDKRIYIGAPTSSYIVAFKVDQLALQVIAGANEVRSSTAGFTIQRSGSTIMQLQWGLTIDSIAPGILGDFGSTPAPFVATSVTPATLPIGSSSYIPDVSINVTSPGAVFLLDLGGFITGQKFTITYDMFARIQGTGFGNGFASIGDPFGFGGGEGIDYFGLSISEVPAPPALVLFGLGLVALVRRRAR